MTKWVSVNKRLPDIFVDVLVYNPFNEVSIMIAFREKGDNGGWRWNSQMAYPNELVDVTHWMPLPKPPEEPHD